MSSGEAFATTAPVRFAIPPHALPRAVDEDRLGRPDVGEVGTGQVTALEPRATQLGRPEVRPGQPAVHELDGQARGEPERGQVRHAVDEPDMTQCGCRPGGPGQPTSLEEHPVERRLVERDVGQVAPHQGAVGHGELLDVRPGQPTTAEPTGLQVDQPCGALGQVGVVPVDVLQQRVVDEVVVGKDARAAGVAQSRGEPAYRFGTGRHPATLQAAYDARARQTSWAAL
jgi:hypothetical protein